MTTGNTVITIMEIIVAGLIIAGLFNENKLAEWEDKLFAAVKRKIKKPRRSAHRFSVVESRERKLAS